MKTKISKQLLAGMAIAGLFFGLSVARAQDTAAIDVAQPSKTSSPAPQLSYGVPQILQLTQAKVSDGTIIAYIKSSGNSYGLTADQIIYLRQQGVSDAVLTTMLTQPRPANVMTPATPAPQPVAATTTGSDQVSTATVAPTVTYVQTVPATTYYYQPYSYYPYYYYPYYPSVSLSFGWGGSWGGYYRGGYYGGYHGGGYGGYHGGHGGWHR